MKNVIEGLGHTLTEVRIVELREGVFHAALILDGTTEISSRSSDAIALALRTGTTIVAGESLLEEAGVAMSAEEDKDDEVERFREFLDNVSAEDFETGQGEPGP
jgi:bifunctional DNase/RNase